MLEQGRIADACPLRLLLGPLVPKAQAAGTPSRANRSAQRFSDIHAAFVIADQITTQRDGRVAFCSVPALHPALPPPTPPQTATCCTAVYCPQYTDVLDLPCDQQSVPNLSTHVQRSLLTPLLPLSHVKAASQARQVQPPAAGGGGLRRRSRGGTCPAALAVSLPHFPTFTASVAALAKRRRAHKINGNAARRADDACRGRGQGRRGEQKEQTRASERWKRKGLQGTKQSGGGNSGVSKRRLVQKVERRSGVRRTLVE